jgi:hypothetical protein
MLARKLNLDPTGVGSSPQMTYSQMTQKYLPSLGAPKDEPPAKCESLATMEQSAAFRQNATELLDLNSE